jgi:hypothetical protein
VLVGAGGPAGIDRGQFLEPVAFQAVQQPPELQDPDGPDAVRQTVHILGSQEAWGRTAGPIEPGRANGARTPPTHRTGE